MNQARIAGTLALAVVVAPACSSSSSGVAGNSADGGNRWPSQLGYTPPADPIQDGNGHTLKTFAPPGDPGAGAFVFTISGEVERHRGLRVSTLRSSRRPGWSTAGTGRSTSTSSSSTTSRSGPNPNESPSDQSQHGAQVAHVDGPFVVDLHKGGPLDGKGGGGEQALAIAALTNQNDNGGAAFDPIDDYGFGFSTVQAPSDGSAINVNLTADEQADFSTW